MPEKTLSTPIVADKGHPMSWALPDGAISRFGHGCLRAMAVSPDGAYLTVATKIGLWWYELSTMQPVALWETERGMLSAIAISHDGRLAATGNWDGVIKVWNIQRSVCITKIVRPLKKIHTLVLQFGLLPFHLITSTWPQLVTATRLSTPGTPEPAHR